MATPKILIVEDEGIEALDIQYRLINLGYSAPEIAYSGEEAIQKVEELCPDLVLMDIMLRGEMDGIAAAEQIHSRFDIPVVYLTAYADNDTLRRAKITGPFGYLVKPFKERELHVTIDVALYKHKMEKKLRESEKWLATTLRSIGDAVVATDKNGFINFMNPIAEDLMGWKMEEVVNSRLSKWFNIINKDTRTKVESPVDKVLQEGTIVGLANHTILIARNGTEIPIDDSAAPIKDDKGDISGVVLVFRDVTERENALAEICRYRDQLEARVRERTSELAKANEGLKDYAGKLERLNEELQEFAFVASHDLQEPLRKIQTFGHLLTRNHADKLASEGQDYVARMTNAAKRMSDLLDSLLNYSRIATQPRPFEPVDLTAVARDVVCDLECAIKKTGSGIEIGELPQIDADPVQIRQLLQNLISNSIKYSNDGERPVVKIHGRSSGTGCTIFIEDNGIGFEEQYVDRIFRPFQRLHGRSDKFEGIGMGLAICRKIVERHKGSITARSTPGQGSTFIVQLPASRLKSSRNIDEESSCSMLFLMADDDGEDCILAESAFEEAKISGEIRFVGDGRDLLEYLWNECEKDPERMQLPDLILLDLNMPRKDGREALKEIKGDSRLRDIPVVILSTSRDERDIKLCRDAGASGFIVKPVLFNEWVNAFSSLPRHLKTESRISRQKEHPGLNVHPR